LKLKLFLNENTNLFVILSKLKQTKKKGKLLFYKLEMDNKKKKKIYNLTNNVNN
jgi:hypothetical protein